MSRRSEDNRRPRESPTTIAMIGRPGKHGVPSTAPQFWESRKVMKEQGLVGLPWNTFIWKCEIPVEKDIEPDEPADTDEQQTQGPPSNGPYLSYGYASWRLVHVWRMSVVIGPC